MDSTLVNLGAAFLTSALSSKNTSATDPAPGISVPGTIVANLASVSETQSYMQNFARYNNYLTDNYGAAQQASDRYMSLKERIPMSMEYYLTPTQKKEIVMYINPNQLNISTTKMKQKVITRGGIYFHHFGDDVWSMKLQGELGYSQMKGVEALEEAYYYSGALLKYGNINAETLHTTQITDSESSSSSSSNTSTASLLDELASSGSTGKWLSGVLGTATDALGITSNNGDGTHSTGSGQNFITKALSAATGWATSLGNAQGSLMNATVKATGATNTGTFLSNILTSTTNQLGAAQNALSLGNLTKAFAADALTSITGGSGTGLASVAKVFTGNATGGINNILNLLNGNYDSLATSDTFELPTGSTSGNYYKLNSICASDLATVVSSAQDYTSNHTIDKSAVSSKIADLTTDLTDPYRPRMILIYFDDRVYIGHFDSFNWTRKADNLSIAYDMSFTVVRQVLVGRSSQKSEDATSTLQNLLVGAGVNMLSSSLLGNKSSGSDSASASSGTASSSSGNNKDLKS